MLAPDHTLTRRRSLGLLAAAFTGAVLAAGIALAGFAALVPRFPMFEAQEILLAEAAGPRLIIESGSGAFYALDAAALGRAASRNGINIADNAGYNIRHKIFRLLAHARPGDAVLLPLEWAGYEKPDMLYGQYLEDATTRLTGYFHAVPWPEKARMAASMALQDSTAALWQNLGRALRGPGAGERNQLRRARALVAAGHDGGATVFPAATLRPEAQGVRCEDYIDSPARAGHQPAAANLKPLLDLLDRLKARGVQVAFVPPTVAGDDCYPDPQALRSAVATLRDLLAARGYAFLGDPLDFSFGVEMRTDTPFHVLPAARTLATARMAALLPAAGFVLPAGDGTGVERRAAE